jgi:hypothetical protein
MKTSTQDLPGTPQHELRTKLAKEATNRKKTKTPVLETWYELRPDSSNKRGGEVRKVQKTKNATHRTYICREKEKPEWVKKLKDEKKLVIV